MGQKARRLHLYASQVSPKGPPLDLAGSMNGEKGSALQALTSMSG